MAPYYIYNPKNVKSGSLFFLKKCFLSAFSRRKWWYRRDFLPPDKNLSGFFGVLYSIIYFLSSHVLANMRSSSVTETANLVLSFVAIPL